jgi:hypothetical protein
MRVMSCSVTCFSANENCKAPILCLDAPICREKARPATGGFVRSRWIFEIAGVSSPTRQLLLSKQPSDGNGVVGVKAQYEISNLLTFGRTPEKFPLVRPEFLEPSRDICSVVVEVRGV